MRVAVVQTNPVPGNGDRNRARARAWMERVPADLYVLPELAFSGYNFASRGQVRARAESAEGPSARWAADFCRATGAHVLYGFPEAAGGGIYNAAALVGPRGRRGIYRKVHLFGQEKRFFRPGGAPFPVWDIGGARVGVLICFDWFFPEAARSLALAGAEVLLHPANLVLPHGPDAMITRCLENRVFAATANRVGRESGAAGPLSFIGRSQIVSPRGERLVRLGPAREGVAVARIDPRAARDKRLGSGNDLFRERRPALYRLSRHRSLPSQNPGPPS